VELKIEVFYVLLAGACENVNQQYQQDAARTETPILQPPPPYSAAAQPTGYNSMGSTEPTAPTDGPYPPPAGPYPPHAGSYPPPAYTNKGYTADTKY